MRGIGRELALLLIGLLQRNHGLAREDMSDNRRDNQGDSPEEGQCVRRFFHAVVHGRDILADVDRLRRVALVIADLLRRHHDARLARILRTWLAENRDFARCDLVLRNRVENERLDAKRSARKVQQASVIIEDVKEQAVIRALVGNRIIEHDFRMLVEILLCLRDVAGRVHEFTGLLRRDGPFHGLVHRKEQQHEEDNHDNRVENRQFTPAAAKDVLRHQLLASSL